MADEPDWCEEVPAMLLEADDARRLDRIQAMSDDELSRCYVVLSDVRYARNVPFLSELEAELKARGLPLGRRH